MPAQRAAAKRKAPEAGHAPLSSSKAKRRPVTNDASGSTTAGTAGKAASPVATKFMTGLANHLASDDMGQDTAAIEGALRAAVGALPKGKLKSELARDEALTVERLVAEVRAVKAKKQAHTAVASSAAAAGPSETVLLPGKNKARVAQVSGGGGGGDAAATRQQGDVVVPCTVELYGRARRQAEESSGGGGGSGNQSSLLLLRSLALNPRAPLDLLVEAMGTDAGALSGTTRQAVDGGGGLGASVAADKDRLSGEASALESGVVGMRSLVKALAADPRAAVSTSGVAFYADRAADLAAAIAAALTAEAFVGSRGGVSGGGLSRRTGLSDDNNAAIAAAAAAAAVATEGLGLMLRVLQLAGFAVSAASSSAPPASDGGGGGSGGGGCLADPADALLLSCLPGTTSTTTAGAGAGGPGAASGAGAGAGAGGDGAAGGGGARALPPARVSVGRLLAHYAAAMAACCAAGWKGGAAALVKGARSAAVAAVGEKRGDGDESSSSSSSSDDDDESGDDEQAVASRSGGGGGHGGGALWRHLSALCAGHLSGNETATLEFLRCVGDATFPASEGSGSGSGSGQPRHPSLPVAAAASLAPTCARALARLPRPSASPPPTAAQFLKRAYAYRVVEALGQAAASRSKGATTAAGGGGGRGRGRGGGANAPGIGDTSAVRPWDFVGAAAAPVALLDFLGRPEAPLAVGGGAAGAALAELASRRRKPAAVAELLRSSAACAPASLGPLLSAMERLGGAEGGGGEIGSGGGEGRSGGGGGGGDGGGEGGAAGGGEVGGFFVDTGADDAGEAGAGLVLAPMGSGRGAAVGMEEEGGEEEREEREGSVSGDDMSASEQERDW